MHKSGGVTVVNACLENGAKVSSGSAARAAASVARRASRESDRIPVAAEGEKGGGPHVAVDGVVPEEFAHVFEIHRSAADPYPSAADASFRAHEGRSAIAVAALVAPLAARVW